MIGTLLKPYTTYIAIAVVALVLGYIGVLKVNASTLEKKNVLLIQDKAVLDQALKNCNDGVDAFKAEGDRRLEAAKRAEKAADARLDEARRLILIAREIPEANTCDGAALRLIKQLQGVIWAD